MTLSLRDVLRGIPLFSQLSVEDLDLVAARLHKESYSKGTILFELGDLGDTMYLVESGQLAVMGRDAKDTIALMGPGNFVGDISLLLAGERTATVQVTIDAELWVLNKKDFDSLIQARPAIALEMMRELSRRLITTTRRRRKTIPRRITAIFGGDYGLKLAESIQGYLKSDVALLSLSQAKVSHTKKLSDNLILLENEDLTETSLPQNLSHQVEIYKHIIIILPAQPDKLVYKAIDLANTVICIENAPDWLLSKKELEHIWTFAEATLDFKYIARKVTNRVTGLALSSGGTKGLVHIGVLKALTAEKIPIDMLAGSSAGALFGGLFAAGWSFEKIVDYVHNLKNLTRIENWDFNIPPSTGLAKGRKARDKFLAQPLQNCQFEDLNMPLYIVAGDVFTGEEVVFDSGSLADAIRASASIPILGDPWHYQNRFLIDGGAVNPLPASVLRQHGADIIIASNVVQSPKEAYSGPKDRMPNLAQTISNIITLVETEMIKKQLPLIDVLIHHNVSVEHSLDFEHADEFIKLGEEATYQTLPAIRDILENPPEK